MINLKKLSTYEKQDLIKDFVLHPETSVTEDDAQNALAKLYFEAQLAENRELFAISTYTMPKALEHFNEIKVKKNLWKKLLEKVCPLIDEDTERDVIAQIVINAIKDLIPFGFILEAPLKKLVSYFLGKTYISACKTVDIAHLANLFIEAGKKRFNYKASVDFITAAVEKANKLLESKEFYEELAKIKNFDGTNITGEVLANLIKISKVEAIVEIYKSKWPWSSVNAYTSPQQPDIIKLNYNQFKKRKDPNSWAVTLIHEYIHLVDFENLDYTFGHEGNLRKENENTAPYKVEKIAEKLLSNS